MNEQYFDQLEYSGYYARDNDVKLIADLGIRALRFPVLWERHQPEKNGAIDWSWTEQRLNELRVLNINPIAGLVHHGSGPKHVNLLSDSFAEELQEYAFKVASQFPWLESYTPVNEPLTTARFSGLYGFWYPHHKDHGSFVRMLINQLKGIVLSMGAIRTVNPEAKLIQTEDLGKTYSTPLLRYQAAYENHRRWLTYDFLCGKVIPGHAFWQNLLESGISEEDLLFFHYNPCPPDIMGFNHYITSERYLDENYQKYPPHTYGGNHVHRYADLEAVRVTHSEPSGLEVLLKEAWTRYGLPLAITEVHLHCTREEQLRWFKEKYENCCSLIRQGVPIKAVTAWSLFGAFGWNRLLTHPRGDYEPGVFSITSGSPRPTALANYIKTLNGVGSKPHPIILDKGWWHRDIRLLYDNEFAERIPVYCKSSVAPLLIIGKNGTLGKAFARICEDRGLAYRLLSRQDVNICNEKEIETSINVYKPWAIVNAAGYVRVDDAESDSDRCFAENAKGPELLAKACRLHGIKLMTFSSDLVFDGTKQTPYLESDTVNALNVYGKSKVEAESMVLAADNTALVVRTSAFFGPWDQYNFVNHVVNSLLTSQHFHVMKDVHISPTYVPDLVNTSLDLLIDNENGIWHISNNGETTWADMAFEIARMGGYNKDYLKPRSLRRMDLKAPRPVYSVLKSEKGIILPSLENALNRYFDARPELSIAQAV